MILAFWMDKVMRLCATRSLRTESGATLVEYTLLLVLIVIAAFVAMQFLGGSVSNSINNSASSLFSSP